MTDIKLPETRPVASPLFLRDEELKQGLDLLLFAFRDVSAEGDVRLKQEGFGRAHWRAIYVVGRNPGLTVADLLRALGITKQSLNRVLKDLVAERYIESRTAPSDRRKRLLRLTDKGQALDAAIWETQRGRIVRAFRDAGPDAVLGFRKVLSGLVNAERRGLTPTAQARK